MVDLGVEHWLVRKVVVGDCKGVVLSGEMVALLVKEVVGEHLDEIGE